jgi:broad specificity phosphatase PhoE
MSPGTELYLVRHGQSIHNQEQMIAGQLDSELTPQGFEDARQVARAVGRHDFDLIYSSDLKRARQTADILVETLQLHCPLITTPLLRELDYGCFTNAPFREAAEYLDYRANRAQKYPGGEGFQDLEQRVARFLIQLRSEGSGKRILVTAHAGSIRMLVILLEPARRGEFLAQSFGNRYLGQMSFDQAWNLMTYRWVADVSGTLHAGDEINAQ